MKKTYILSIAAVAMLGAGALYASPEIQRPPLTIVSVCTEPDPSIAADATRYYNVLGPEWSSKEIDAGMTAYEDSKDHIYNPEKDGELAEDPDYNDLERRSNAVQNRITNENIDDSETSIYEDIGTLIINMGGDPANGDSLDSTHKNISSALGSAGQLEGLKTHKKVIALQGAIEKPTTDSATVDIAIGVPGHLQTITANSTLQERIIDVGLAIQKNDATAIPAVDTDTSMALRVQSVGALVSDTNPFSFNTAANPVETLGANSLYAQMVTQKEAMQKSNDAEGHADYETATSTTLAARISNVKEAIQVSNDDDDADVSETAIATPMAQRIDSVQKAIATAANLGDEDESPSLAERAVALGALIGTTTGVIETSNPFEIHAPGAEAVEGTDVLGNNSLYAQLNTLMGAIDTFLTDNLINGAEVNQAYSTATDDMTGVTTVQGVLDALNAVTFVGG